MKILSPRLVLLVSLCSLPRVGFCTQEAVLRLAPVEISMRVNAGAPFGEVSMTVRNNESGTVQTISSITLQVGGKSISIPEKAYSNLGAALLNTVELMKPDGDGALYISFETQFRASDGQSLRRIVRLTYRDGRIESRMIGTRSSDYDGKGEGSTSWTNEKL